MRNENRVPLKQWRKWSSTAQRVFNETYRFLMRNPDLVRHPADPLPKTTKASQHWKTIAWNAAWIGADAADESVPAEIADILDGKVLRVRKVA